MTPPIINLNHDTDASNKDRAEAPASPKIELNINMSQSLTDNSTQGSTAESSGPAPTQGQILPTAFLALLDIVIILILLRYILGKRSSRHFKSFR